MPGRLTPLKLALLEEGFSQCDFAEKARMDRSRLSMACNGRVALSTDERLKIAKLLGLDERMLFPRHPTDVKVILAPA